MVRADLIRRLADMDALTPAACFALLWTYFEHDDVGLSSVEDLVRERYDHVLRLDPYPCSSDLASALKELREADDKEFDLLALRLLKGLDRLLSEGELSDFEHAELDGVDGRPYTVRSRNPFLALHYGLPTETDDSLEADRIPSVTSVSRQGLSMAAYCRHYAVIPCGPVHGLRILCKSVESWAGSYFRDRLRTERDRLRIMLWPFQCKIDYPAFQALKESPPPIHVRLDQPVNEEDLQREVEHALEVARRENVTLLVFPELAVPPGTDQQVRSILASYGIDGHPILTLYGCSHRWNDSGTLDLNEAVLLGPNGSELHRHRKLAAFTDYTFGELHPCGEKLETGKTIAILECALGNLTPLICLDVLNETVAEVVYRSHGSLFAVPSLSPETGAHQTAALKLQVRNLGSTFVCNRWAENPSDKSTSFFRIPRSGGQVRHFPNPKDERYLLFDLLQNP